MMTSILFIKNTTNSICCLAEMFNQKSDEIPQKKQNKTNDYNFNVNNNNT